MGRPGIEGLTIGRKSAPMLFADVSDTVNTSRVC